MSLDLEFVIYGLSVCLFFLFLELTFATGSHVGELIVWDAVDWTMQAYESSWDASLHVDPQQEIKLSHSQNKVSVEHLASDEEVKAFNIIKLQTNQNYSFCQLMLTWSIYFIHLLSHLSRMCTQVSSQHNFRTEAKQS